jgi:acetoin utilization deacetylase AcuC-like enzyme
MIRMDGNGLRGRRRRLGEEEGVPLDLEQMREIADAWVDLHRLPEVSPERQGKLWSFDRLWELVHDDPEAAWNVIQIIRRERSDLILSNLAAGPLEDLLVTHGDRFIDRIETLAEHDAQFRRLLAATWQNSISPRLWKRIKAAAGPSW